jgi:hypothetical protein
MIEGYANLTWHRIPITSVCDHDWDSSGDTYIISDKFGKMEVTTGPLVHVCRKCKQLRVLLSAERP